jgi:hypothetical protein
MAELIETDNHLSSLTERHRRIEQAIEEESSRPHPDEFRLHALKREKLRLKDEMTVLRSQMAG